MEAKKTIPVPLRIVIISFFIIMFWIVLPVFVLLWVNCHPHREPVGLSPAIYGLAYSDVFLHTTDGLTISGWFIPAPEIVDPSCKIGMVLIHGYGENRDSMLEQAAYLHNKHGIATLLIDMRGHGNSESSFYTYGITEAEDIEAGLLYLQKHLEDIALLGVWGFSAGAQAAIHAIAETDVTIAFAILESSPLIEKPDLTLEMIFTWLMTGVRLQESSDTELFKKIDIPLLVIVGEQEVFFAKNVQWMKQHFNKTTSRSVIIPHAGHGGCWGPLLKKEIDQFLDEHIVLSVAGE